jgi:hypothetical protein
MVALAATTTVIFARYQERERNREREGKEENKNKKQQRGPSCDQTKGLLVLFEHLQTARTWPYLG